MNNASGIRLVAFLIIASASTVAAQPQPPGTAPNLDRRVFLDVNGVTPSAVLDKLADTIACTLDVDPALPQPDLSVRLLNVRARVALDALCDMVGCEWKLDGRNLRVRFTSSPPPVPAAQQWLTKMKTPLAGEEWKLDRVPLHVVLERLSRQLGADLVLEGPDPGAVVSYDLRGRTPLDAIERITEVLGYRPRRRIYAFQWAP